MDVQTRNIFFNNGRYTTDTLSFPDSERTEVPHFGKDQDIILMLLRIDYYTMLSDGKYSGLASSVEGCGKRMFFLLH